MQLGTQVVNNRGGNWTTRDLAMAAKVTPAYIRQLILAGKLRGAYKLGRDWLIPDTVARRWLESREQG
jgi:hypothetical protein